MLAELQRAASRLFPSPRPIRRRETRGFRLFPSVGASLAATFLALTFYYLTLPQGAIRLDMAQCFGTLLLPPTPSPLTWKLGLFAWAGFLTAAGLAFAVLLAWGMTVSSVRKGAAYGVALWLLFSLFLTLANGFHPAVMRNALPDTGLFLLGWSGLATLQLLLTFLLFGFVLGALYRRATPQAALTGKSR